MVLELTRDTVFLYGQRGFSCNFEGNKPINVSCMENKELVMLNWDAIEVEDAAVTGGPARPFMSEKV